MDDTVSFYVSLVICMYVCMLYVCLTLSHALTPTEYKIATP